MKNTIYKLTLNKQNNQSCLSLYQNNLQVRKWFGEFASIIFETTTKEFLKIYSSDNSFCLCKQQVRHFFIQVTCLHQQAIWHYGIRKDLCSIQFPTKYTCIAESLLLQIRMNKGHPSYDQLLSNYLDVFQNRDHEIFYIAINILLENDLIQLIETDDGNKFFDKNPIPHSHLYFRQHNKLVDSTEEMSIFFQELNQIQKSSTANANIYYFDKSLKV